MAFENVKKYFDQVGMGSRIKVMEQSTATVEQAANAIGCAPEKIAKTMSFLLGEEAILVVTAGDARVDNKKFKTTFGQKAKMIPGELVESYIGHKPGGVCPFAINSNVNVYLDISLKRFEVIYPAAGSSQSAVELSLDELEHHSASKDWVDVCNVPVAE